MLAAAVLILAFVLAILAGLSALAGRELLHLRARVIELERDGGKATGKVAGLETAIEQAGLGQQLSTAKARVEELQADVERMRFDQRAALERAQEATKMVALPSPYYPRNGG